MKPKPGSLRSSQRLQGSFPSLQSFVAALFLLRDVSCQQGFCQLCPGCCQNPPLCCARPCSCPFPSPGGTSPSFLSRPTLTNPVCHLCQSREGHFLSGFLRFPPLPSLCLDLFIIYWSFMAFREELHHPWRGMRCLTLLQQKQGEGIFFFGMASRELLDPVTGPSDSVFFPLGAVSEAHVTPLVLTRAELLEIFFLKVVCESTEKVCECIHGFFFFTPLFLLFFFFPLQKTKGNFGSCKTKWDSGIGLEMWI